MIPLFAQSIEASFKNAEKKIFILKTKLSEMYGVIFDSICSCFLIQQRRSTSRESLVISDVPPVLPVIKIVEKAHFKLTFHCVRLKV